MEILENIFSDYNDIFSAGRTMPEMAEMKKTADEFSENAKKFIEEQKKRQNICDNENKCYICNDKQPNY